MSYYPVLNFKAWSNGVSTGVAPDIAWSAWGTTPATLPVTAKKGYFYTPANQYPNPGDLANFIIDPASGSVEDPLTLLVASSVITAVGSGNLVASAANLLTRTGIDANIQVGDLISFGLDTTNTGKSFRVTDVDTNVLTVAKTSQVLTDETVVSGDIATHITITRPTISTLTITSAALTFATNGTITRATGSWIDEIGPVGTIAYLDFAGSTLNQYATKVTVVSATVLIVDLPSLIVAETKTFVATGFKDVPSTLVNWLADSTKKKYGSLWKSEKNGVTYFCPKVTFTGNVGVSLQFVGTFQSQQVGIYLVEELNEVITSTALVSPTLVPSTGGTLTNCANVSHDFTEGANYWIEVRFEKTISSTIGFNVVYSWEIIPTTLTSSASDYNNVNTIGQDYKFGISNTHWSEVQGKYGSGLLGTN